MKLCSIEGCDRAHYARGWCSKHYKRWHAHGDPTATEVIRDDDIARFRAYVDTDGPITEHRPDLGPCHLWTGTVDTSGYGVARFDGRYQKAHRVTFAIEGETIPDGLQVDHLCRVRPCVRRSHLEPVTQAENIARGEVGRHNSSKTHCPYGHPLDGRSAAGRRCLTCHRETERERRERRKAS